MVEMASDDQLVATEAVRTYEDAVGELIDVSGYSPDVRTPQSIQRRRSLLTELSTLATVDGLGLGEQSATPDSN